MIAELPIPTSVQERRAALPVPRTIAEYLAMPEGAPYFQFIHGKPKQMPSPTFQHQSILMAISFALNTFVTRHNLGVVAFAPLDVYLDGRNYVQPDAMFISHERTSIIQKRIHGAPDLVVEILSPSNAEDDVVEKKSVYEAHRVREYWIIDPDAQTIEVWVNSENGFERGSSAEKRGAVISSVLQGFSVNAEDIFQG
jgi:Uma2 family endonuclease